MKYTIDDLRGKYVKVGTPECDEFLKACVKLNVTWVGGISAKFVTYNAEFIGISKLIYDPITLGHSREEYWVREGFVPFVPKTDKMGIKRYYIAGPMTGYTNFNREAFNAVCYDLREQGHTVLNPAVLPNGLTQAQYMDICLAMLRCVTHVIMLEGWQGSQGAQIEHSLAIKSDLIVEYQR